LPLGGDFERQGGEKNKGGDRGKNNTKGAKTLNHYHWLIPELTSAVTLMLSKQRNRWLVH